MPAKRRRSTSAAAASSSSAPVKGSWSYKTAAAQAAAETAVASAAAACKKRTKPGAEVSAFVEREEMLKFTRHYDRQKLMSVRDSPARNEFIRRRQSTTQLLGSRSIVPLLSEAGNGVCISSRASHVDYYSLLE